MSKTRSHPSWVCGLKQHHLVISLGTKRSHPSWVCGLKRIATKELFERLNVTPFVGVWIETLAMPNCLSVDISHTLRGCVDWNLSINMCINVHVESHPSWVCGLKPRKPTRWKSGWMSHPSWVCGLKHNLTIKIFPQLRSHPSWVCGLKLRNCCETNCEGKSHPSWVCGLKHAVGREIWETRSHTLRGCVDWNRKQILFSEPTWKSHFYENVPLIVNKLQWQKIWFGTSLSGLSLVLYSNL